MPACNQLQSSHPGPAAIVTASQADALGSTPFQIHPSWSAAISSPSHYTAAAGLSPFAKRVEGPLPAPSLLDQLPEDAFFMNLFAAADGLGDEEQQVAGQDEIEEIQPHVPHMVLDFVAKVRALAVWTRLRELGAAAQSPALESSPRRWQRAVLAIRANRRPLRVDNPIERGEADDMLIRNIIMDDLDIGMRPL